jgi:GAF domain-containing protein
MATRRHPAKGPATAPKRAKPVRKGKLGNPKPHRPKPEIARLKAELREALEQQTAMAEVLQVINASPGRLEPVFDALLERATLLCEADGGVFTTHEGSGLFRWASLRGFSGTAEFLLDPIVPHAESGVGRVFRGETIVHILDSAAGTAYNSGDLGRRTIVELGGARTQLCAGLRKDGALLGAFIIWRRDVRPFSDRQIALLQNFAAQAVIAMENARLLGELRKRTDDLTESLEYQAATSEVLEVIGRSTAEIQPVLDTMLSAALRLCRTESGGIAIQQGEGFRYVATLGWDPEADRIFRCLDITAGRGTIAARVLAEGRIVQVADVAADPEFALPDVAEFAHWHTALGVPLMREGRPIGVIAITRDRVEPFTERQIALVKTFADQAVIAMENARLLVEQREALEQQTATAEVLQVINASPGNLIPVFDAMLDKAMTLCGAAFGFLTSYDGERFTAVAMRGVPPSLARYFTKGMDQPSPGEMHFRILQGEDVIHTLDQKEEEAYRAGLPLRRAVVDLGGGRTALVVALRKDGALLGALTIYRKEVRPFSDKQIALMRDFAAQAVVAIENARLLGQVTRREQELSVTFEHMGDGVVMFDADLRIGAWNRNFQELLDVPDSFLAGRPSLDDYVALLVERGEVGQGNPAEEIARYRERASRPWSNERTRPDGRTIEVRNNPIPGGGAVLIYGDITARKRAEAEIAAARDAAEAALERQTATADILKVIASSPSDSQPAFAAIARSANRLLGGRSTAVWRFEGDKAFLESFTPISPEADEPVKALSPALIAERPNLVELRRGQVVHYPDTEKSVLGRFREIGRLRGFRAQLFVPLLAQGEAIGFISVTRTEVGAFVPDDIQLLQTFADQAVIAIQNTRLFTDLSESLEQQTATAEILTVISQSPTDVGPVLSAVAKAAMKFCGANDALVVLREGDEFSIAAHEGPIGAMIGMRRRLTRHTAPGRAMTDGMLVQIRDLQSEEGDEFPEGRELGARSGFRSTLAAPLLRDGVSMGAISLRRREAGAFEPRQVELLKTFAAQAVIAIENVRLFTELRDSLERLKAAQANLIQAEKMASLGQLTAGIAHEIKNPLNFVNNFAGLSSELLDELKQAVDALLAEPDEHKRAEVQETMDLLTGNLAKIVEHGRRADGIVKSMLAHSRGGTGDWQESSINALIEEALNLAYHGARAQDKDFNVALQRDFAEAKPIEVVPQDVMRVFLNLFGNGFYATRKRDRSGADARYLPTLAVSTRDLGEVVEVRVRDNGTGIPPEVRAKLFQPFFTTKPTGEGTGLGLSISYDIVTQQHGGSIEVESEPGSFTEFTVRLPRRRRA